MTDQLKDELILVTGGSGFIGVHCILKLLEAGYRVRTTVRSAKREKDVIGMLKVGKAPHIDDRLSFAQTELIKDDGWKEAVEGCSYVLHVASPFPAGAPKHEDELIIPAREGTLRVLRAAKEAGVKRVVVTSSLAAVAYGPTQPGHVYTEEDWTPADSKLVAAYQKSKTVAEKAAWDYIKNEGGSMELSVVLPVAVLGPVLGPDTSTSIEVVKRCLDGDLPACPQIGFGIVDVRDVAELHLMCMMDPKAKGERFIACCDAPGNAPMSIQEVSLTLRERLPKEAKKAPRYNLPNIFLRLIALFDPAVALIVPELGVKRCMTNEKAKKVLGWTPRSREDAVVATAESLIKLGLVKK